MPYPEELVKPMREELTRIGVTELKSAAEVDAYMAQKQGTTMIVVNSVCGCAAGGARPGIARFLQSPQKPDRVATVFAGQDKEAVDRVRSLIPQVPPSSPSIAIFKDGELIHFVPRHMIEGQSPANIAAGLSEAFSEAVK